MAQRLTSFAQAGAMGPIESAPGSTGISIRSSSPADFWLRSLAGDTRGSLTAPHRRARISLTVSVGNMRAAEML